MSFVISLYVRQGIVMAADSRATLSSAFQQGTTQIVQSAVGLSDSANKLFLAGDRIGICTYGAADIAGVPIAGFIESFIEQNLTPEMSVELAASSLLSYFRAMTPIPVTYFHVAGYQANADGTQDQQLWVIDVQNGTSTRANQTPGFFGAQWGGETDVLMRLLNRVAPLDAGGIPQP